MKTPIAIIKNYAEMLRMEYISEAQRKEYAKSIGNAATRLSVLLAVPGFIGWIISYFLYRKIAGNQTETGQV